MTPEERAIYQSQRMMAQDYGDYNSYSPSSSVMPTKSVVKEEPKKEKSAEDRAVEGQRMKTGAAMAKSAPQGGIPLADSAGKGLMMTGNPYAMAAGLGLSTYSQIKGQQQKEEYDAYQKKVDALNNLMNWSRGIRSL